MSLGHSSPIAVVAERAVNPVIRYPVFHGTMPIGHGRTLTIDGPLLLGQYDARGQVVGGIYLADGSIARVVGQVYGNEVSLRISLPNGRVVHAGGTGLWKHVRGGISGYDALIGSGPLTPATGPFVQGKWRTTKSFV